MLNAKLVSIAGLLIRPEKSCCSLKVSRTQKAWPNKQAPPLYPS
jgi:hypothetical protein